MKIDEYPEITTINPNDLLLVETANDNAYKKIQKNNLLAGAGGGGGIQLAQLADIRPNGQSAGAAVHSTWTARHITDILYNDLGIVVINDFITMFPGKYYLNCGAQFYLPEAARLRLQDTTHNVTLLLGMTSYSYGSNEAADCRLSGVFSLDNPTNVQIQYYFSGTNLQVHNLGVNSACGVNEVYLLADIFKVG